jgi:glucose/arabinose dehydrogenase
MGFTLQASRKKGILLEKDLKQRLKFAKSMIKSNVDYWTKDIAFYLDGVLFIHKTNPASDALKPKSKVWRKRNEGLVVTTKDSKDLAGGMRLHVLVAISYRKGVIMAKSYEKMNAEFFLHFVK